MTITAMVFRLGQPPHREEIGTDLTAWQKIVGGYIEMVNLVPLKDGDSITMIVNEEGTMNQTKLNRLMPGYAALLDESQFDFVIKLIDGAAVPGTWGGHYVHGDFFIIRTAHDGNVKSLKAEDIAWIWEACDVITCNVPRECLVHRDGSCL